MEQRFFEKKPHGKVELDLCFTCHAIWFDQYESATLTPGAVIEKPLAAPKTSVPSGIGVATGTSDRGGVGLPNCPAGLSPQHQTGMGWPERTAHRKL